jgi:hypothetical protein
MTQHLARSAPVSGPRAVRAARWISEFTFPPVVVAAALLVASFLAGPTAGASLRDWVVATTFASVAPSLAVFRGVQKGHLSHHQVPIRAQRIVPVVFALLSTTVGLIVLLWTGAAHEVVALYMCGLSVGLVLGMITTRYKVSAHTAVLCGAIQALALITSTWAVVLLSAVVPVWWARRVLGAHTHRQLALGTGVGLLVPWLTLTAIAVL